ncbi:MAG: ATP-binding domain-containing protein [Eubacteriales bacterium]|nr:ATP-binding domain-containing protein [Eubacteriales bacterium]
MTLIYIRLLSPEKCEDFSQIIVDEAQDFGPSVYYALSRALPGCRFTIMGDISQNIHYETGMNTWESLRHEVFGTKGTKFHVLAKSYRNTIEISEYAGYVLREASAGAYRIQPVIRHGKPVKIWRTGNNTMSGGSALKAMVSLTLTLLEDIRHSGFDTTAVICRDEAEAQTTAELLGIEKSNPDQDNFHTGVMVLPVMYTKGLEFDAVILWDPSPDKYQKREGDAKLLYVAITRALHELHIVCHSILTPLLMDT